jgi:hypothetical protein
LGKTNGYKLGTKDGLCTKQYVPYAVAYDNSREENITNYFIIMSFKDSLNSKRNFDIIRNALITTTSYNSHNFTHPSKKRGIDKELKFSSSSDVKMGETCDDLDEFNYDYNSVPDYTYFEETSGYETIVSPTIYKRLVLNFNINAVVKFYERKMVEYSNLIKDDDKVPLTKEPENVITKGTFARKLLQWFEENEVTNKGQLELLNLMQNAFGTAINLPVKIKPQLPAQKDDESSINSIDILNKTTVLSTIHEYDGSITRFFAFHQCLNDCTVFIGDNHRSFECTICKSLRFRPCVRMNCENKGKSNCEHLLRNDGVPYKQFYYRPIILLLEDLVRTKWFVKALKYKRKNFGKYYEEDTSISENGIVGEQSLSAMKDQFEFWKSKDPKRANHESVNILLSEFYDGAQLFKRRTKDFNCLITGILNLPPTYRGKEGISNFITAVYEGKHKFAEQVIFSDMYVEELRTLLQGIEFQFNGKDYFIQARLVLHIMDTKAAEGVFKLQNCGNSTQGCPSCQLIKGVHDGSKCIYPGHRYLLPLNHYLRPIGQSNKCCPAGFYSENKWFSMEEFPAGRDKVSSVFDAFDSNKKRQQSDFCLPCDGDIERKQKLSEMYSTKDSESRLEWFHTGDFNLEAMKTSLKTILHYRHYDFREYEPYKRYPYKNHMEDAMRAEELNAESDKKTKRSSKGVNGIKGMWPFANYSIADISKHSGPPAIHAITGCVRMLLDIIVGEYILKDPKSKKGIPLSELDATGLDLNSDNVDVAASDDEYSDDDKSSDDDDDVVPSNKKTDVIPSRTSTIYKPEYRPLKPHHSANTGDIRRITCWLQCVLLPKGMSDDSWNIKLNSIGSLKMNQKLKVISCYWDLILFACPSIDSSYKQFFRLVAADLTQMQTLKFSLKDVLHLQNCINETISVWEGALPAKTLHYKVHQLVDLVPILENFGALSNSWEFIGERMIGMVKNLKLHNNTGGGSFGNTVMRKQVRREMRKMRYFFSQSVNLTNRNAPNGKHMQFIDGELIFNDFPFKLHPDSKLKSAKLNCFEINHLVELLLFEIKRRFTLNEDTCLSESVLYKLIKTHRKPGRLFHEILMEAAGFINDSTVKVGEIEGKEIEGKETFSDLEVKVAKTLLHGTTLFHHNACIYGLEFCSRGCDNRQKQAAGVAGYGVQHGKNAFDIRRGKDVIPWDAKVSYSSWCMFRGRIEDRIKFGQLNGFFEISIGDPAIDGLLVASVTSRKYEKVEHVFFVDEYRSLDPHQVFVSVQDICPTLIGVCPFQYDPGLTTKADKHEPKRFKAEHLKAISLDPNKFNNEKSFISNNKQRVSKYAMIVLHPEKLSGQPKYRPYTAFY